MVASRLDADAESVRQTDSEAALPVAAIYGPNASGKSNLLSGFAFMRGAVVHSHRFYSPEGGVPRSAFAWGAKAQEPSFFEAVFKIDGVRYEYGFVANDTLFLEEWLYAYPLARKQVWFERDGSEFKFGEHLRGENRLVEKVTRSNSLFLSAAAQNRHEQLLPIFHWFSSIRSQNVQMGMTLAPGAPPLRRGELALNDRFARWWATSLVDPQPSLFEEAPLSESASRADRFLKLLRAADFGIVDLKISEDRIYGSGSVRIMVRHQSELKDAWLPLEEESHGTRQLFLIAPAILDALERGSVILIDELEASLHPLLALQLIRTFNDADQNPRNAQLIFSTHDTNFLGNMFDPPALRRDQVWLVEKDEGGASRIYPLTDYKPRKAENLERGYLQGRYGAIPFLEALVERPRGER